MCIPASFPRTSFTHPDLSFTLSTSPSSTSFKPSFPVWQLLFQRRTSSRNQADFYGDFSKKVEELHSLLDLIDADKSSMSIKQRVFSHFLIKKIKACLTDLLAYRSKDQLNLTSAQRIYAFAQELKKNEANRKRIWQALPSDHQALFDRLSVWTEDLNVLRGLLPYQWLADGRVERANNQESITDFGSGRLFRVLPPAQQEEGKSHFPLSRLPGFHVVKQSPEVKRQSSLLLIKNEEINFEVIGRLAEIFDIESLFRKIKMKGEETILYYNQFLDLFACYRSALCSVLSLPVSLPAAIDRQGEWTIWNDGEKQPLTNSLCSSSVLADLHHLFHFERVWRINVLHDSSHAPKAAFSVCNDRLFVDGILPLPVFLTQDIDKRHQHLFNHLPFDPTQLEEWNRLEELFKQEEEQEIQLSKEMKVLIDCNALSLEELTTFQPRAMSIVKLLALLVKEYPVKAEQNLFDTAKSLLSVLLSASTSSSYSYEQTQEDRGGVATDAILLAKRDLKGLMLKEVITKVRRGVSIAELIQEKCEELGKELQSELSQKWPFQESIKNHLMQLFGNELLEEINHALRGTVNKQDHLFDKLRLLRSAMKFPQANMTRINQNLQSLLHDSMVKKSSDEFLAHFQGLLN